MLLAFDENSKNVGNYWLMVIALLAEQNAKRKTFYKKMKKCSGFPELKKVNAKKNQKLSIQKGALLCLNACETS